MGKRAWRLGIVVAVVVAAAVVTSPAWAANPAGCAASDDWVNGNLNENNSHYREGDSVPFRTKLTNLTAGTSYSFTIGYDTIQGGKHAYDYLTSYNRTEPGANPCAGF